jgi:flagellar basal-body rod protein FlgB
MSSDLFRGVDAQRRALDFHLSRHNVLASNLANAETPGFRPLELLREQDKGDGGAVAINVSNEGHFATNGVGAGEQYTAREDQTAAPGANGNAVSLEHEMSKLAANDIRFEGAVKIVAQQLAMLRYAANDGTGG